MPYAPGSGAKIGNNVIFSLPDSGGIKIIGVVVRERYARNPSGKLSHNRKELLVQPIKQELYASVLSNCPDELWVVDKSPDVLLWSAKAQEVMIEMNSRLAGYTTDTSDATQESEHADTVTPSAEPAAATGDPPAPRTTATAVTSCDIAQQTLSKSLDISQAIPSQLEEIETPMLCSPSANVSKNNRQIVTVTNTDCADSAVTSSPDVEQNNPVVPSSSDSRASFTQHESQPPACPTSPSKPLSQEAATSPSKPLSQEAATSPSKPLSQEAAAEVSASDSKDVVAEDFASHSIHAEVSPPDSQHSLVELIASKKPINRLHLESLTTLQLRALCQPRGLKVFGYKNDLVYRLLYSFASESQNREQFDALSSSDLQRLCRDQGLSSSGSKPDLMSRLMDSITGAAGQQDEASGASSAKRPDRKDPPPSNSSSASHKRAAPAPSPLESESSVEMPPQLSSNAAPAAVAPTHKSRAASSFTLSSPRCSSRVAPVSKVRPSSESRSTSRDAHEIPRKRAALPQPSEPKTAARPQLASLDLYFPVPDDVVLAATAPILSETCAPSAAGAASFTLVENRVPSPVRPFPPFVLPPPPQSFTDAVLHQCAPGMSLSSYFQRVPGLPTSTCKLCSIYVPDGSRAHHLRSKHADVYLAAGEPIMSGPALTSKAGSTNSSNQVARLSAEIINSLSAIGLPS